MALSELMGNRSVVCESYLQVSRGREERGGNALKSAGGKQSNLRPFVEQESEVVNSLPL